MRLHRITLPLVCTLASVSIAQQGHGHAGGGGGGGGGLPPPADPAILFLTGPDIARWQFGVMNADGTNVTLLGLYGVNYPSWSPDLDGDPANGYQGSVAFFPCMTGDLWAVDVRVIEGAPRRSPNSWGRTPSRAITSAARSR